MPPYTNIKTFMEALRTGRTNITRGLDELFDHPGRHQSHANFGDLSQAGALGPALPQWARQALRGCGIRDVEIAHIEAKWPPDQREAVRQKLVAAIQSDRTVHFSWQLHDGASPLTDIVDPDASGGIAITFRSPRAGVRVSAVTLGDVSVEA